MDSGDAIQLIVLLLLILLSAFFSSAETAMTTVNKIRIMSLADDGNKKAKTLLKIIENPGKLLSTILIGNNIVNLSASSLATTWTTRVLGNAFIGFITGVLTLLILLFGEITPKTLATLQAEKNLSCLCTGNLSSDQAADSCNFLCESAFARCLISASCRSRCQAKCHDRAGTSYHRGCQS